jgi:hypothetical protein
MVTPVIMLIDYIYLSCNILLEFFFSSNVVKDVWKPLVPVLETRSDTYEYAYYIQIVVFLGVVLCSIVDGYECLFKMFVHCVYKTSSRMCHHQTVT